MTSQVSTPKNFSISASAKLEIENLQKLWTQKTSEEAIALCLSWATYQQFDGKSWDNVAVSFYGRSQESEIAPLVRNVSGIKVVFFLRVGDVDKFKGKMLDYSKDRGMFLSNDVTSGQKD